MIDTNRAKVQIFVKNDPKCFPQPLVVENQQQRDPVKGRLYA